MASFVPLHGSWCWFKVKARARKVPGKARASDEGRRLALGAPAFANRAKEQRGGRPVRRPQVVLCRSKSPPGGRPLYGV
jgi:hypothetical protein